MYNRALDSIVGLILTSPTPKFLGACSTSIMAGQMDWFQGPDHLSDHMFDTLTLQKDIFDLI